MVNRALDVVLQCKFRVITAVCKQSGNLVPRDPFRTRLAHLDTLTILGKCFSESIFKLIGTARGVAAEQGKNGLGWGCLVDKI